MQCFFVILFKTDRVPRFDLFLCLFWPSVTPLTPVNWCFLFFFSGDTCCFHEGDSSNDGKILLFKEESLRKSQCILEIRKQNNLEYTAVILPESIESITGYHLLCYRKCTALSKSQQDKLQEMIEMKEKEKSFSKQKKTRSGMASPRPSTSTGIFPKVCLFCSREKIYSRWNNSDSNIIVIRGN